MFTGQTLPAADLAHTDLVTRLVADDELVDEVDRVAQPSRRRARWG
jgi:enoyl-CoA hydratase/carnithine racemase